MITALPHYRWPNQETDAKYRLNLEGCQVRDVGHGFLSAKKKTFAIFNPDLRY